MCLFKFCIASPSLRRGACQGVLVMINRCPGMRFSKPRSARPQTDDRLVAELRSSATTSVESSPSVHAVDTSRTIDSREHLSCCGALHLVIIIKEQISEYRNYRKKEQKVVDGAKSIGVAVKQLTASVVGSDVCCCTIRG